MSALVEVQERGDRLEDKLLLSACFVLLASGHETIMNLIGNGTLALLRTPTSCTDCSRPETDPLGAGRVLALRQPQPDNHPRRRRSGRDRGALVYLVLGAANRDPQRFDDPDRLDLRRPDNRHLSFGIGVLFCLAAPLARLEGEIAIGVLVRRLPALRLDPGNVEWRSNPALRGPACLPVTY